MKKQQYKNILLGSLTAIIAFSVAIGAAELTFRILIPESRNYYVVLPNLKKMFNPDPVIMSAVEGVANYVINAHGIRGRDFGPDDSEYRILAVGGSTTENLYLDGPETWTYLVQEMLDRTPSGKDLWVGSVGRSGLTSRSHVVEIKHLANQFPKIDAVAVLVGANNLNVTLKQGANYVAPRPITDPVAEEEQIRQAFVA